MKRLGLRACRLLAGATLLLPIVAVRAAAPDAFYFVVDDDCKTLELVSLCAYGRTSSWAKIAEWNGLQAPYSLAIGQKLVLKNPRALGPADTELALLAYWRKRVDRSAEAAPSAPPPAKAALDSANERRIYQAATSPAADTEKPAEPVSAADFFHLGETAYGAHDLERALKSFRKSRELDPGYLTAWFFEIRALDELKRGAEKDEVVGAFLKLRPAFANMPMFKKGGPR
jgi:hypothetical protein